jgi:hypothetical protein
MSAVCHIIHFESVTSYFSINSITDFIDASSNVFYGKNGNPKSNQPNVIPQDAIYMTNCIKIIDVRLHRQDDTVFGLTGANFTKN